MPIFRLDGDKLIIAQETNVELEQHIEIWIENSPWAVIQDELLWIGRQTSAADEERTIFPDLLGIDSEGNLIIIEFKRGRTPRDVVAQLLEYAAWADELPPEQIREIAKDYFKTREEFQEKTFDDAFREAFDMPDDDEIPLFKSEVTFIHSCRRNPRANNPCLPIPPDFIQNGYRLYSGFKVSD